jgi:hypothetical protein
MLPFSRLRFEVYSRDLSAALWDLRDEMGDYGFRSIIVPHRRQELMGVFSKADEMEATIIEPNEFKQEPIGTSLTGLQPGAIRAKLDALKLKAAERRAQAMAKLDGADTKLASVDTAIEQYAARIEKEADDGLAEFATFTNGGPA